MNTNIIEKLRESAALETQGLHALAMQLASPVVNAVGASDRKVTRDYVLGNFKSPWLRHQVLAWDREGRDCLRHIEFGGHTLLTFDLYQCSAEGRNQIGVVLSGPSGEVILETSQGIPGHCAIDSDECVRASLRWLTWNDEESIEEASDTYAAFLEDQAHTLREFAEEEEELRMGLDYKPFTNLDGWVSEHEVEVHGEYHPSYFRGAGLGRWADAATGIGTTDTEAFEDACEALAMHGHLVDDLTHESQGLSLSEADDDGEGFETPWIYVTVRVR
jgi:hypothetical protein